MTMDRSLHLLPGFRFHPIDEEIITHYLLEKVIDPSFKSIAIGDGNFNECEPWDLPGKANLGEKEWYFFCKRDRKYPTGIRTNRATSTGYWKATGKDKEIFQEKGILIGMKKTLVFYSGRAPRGIKTKWVMHEYRLEGKYQYSYFSTSNQDEWVVCKVYNKKDTKSNNTLQQEATNRTNSSFVDDFLIETPLITEKQNSFIHTSFFMQPPEKQFMNHFLHEKIVQGAASSSVNGGNFSAMEQKISSSNFSASIDTGISSERKIEDIGSFQSYENDIYVGVEQVDFDGVWNNELI